MSPLFTGLRGLNHSPGTAGAHGALQPRPPRTSALSHHFARLTSCLGSAFSSGTRWVSGWGGSESPRRREFRRNGRLSFQGLGTAGRCSWEHWPHTVTPLAAETSELSSRGAGPERPPRTTTDHRPDGSHALRTSPRSSPGTLFLRFQSLAPWPSSLAGPLQTEAALSPPSAFTAAHCTQRARPSGLPCRPHRCQKPHWTREVRRCHHTQEGTC